MVTDDSTDTTYNAEDTHSGTQVELFPHLVDTPLKHRESSSITLEKRDERIEDPHFVLGISLDATEEEYGLFLPLVLYTWVFAS